MIAHVLSSIALVAHYHVKNNGSDFDTFWCVYVQLVSTILLVLPTYNLIALSSKYKSYCFLAYLLLSIILGVYAALAFLKEFNDNEINCVYRGICESASDSIVRTGLFIILQVAIIHPTVTSILELWSVQIQSKTARNQE